jgi:hypothetical protein
MTKRRLRVLAAASALTAVLGAVPAAHAQGVTDLEVVGNVVTGVIELPGGLLADLELGFESQSGLDLSTLQFRASVVDPLDLLLKKRLPSGVGIPVGFPVLLEISPTSASQLTFEGVYSLDLHTHNLVYAPNTPLRIFKAPAGGKFEDVTQSMGMGSYRARAGGKSFSDFLIVLDLRSDNSVIDGKYEALDATLRGNAARIDPAVYQQLRGLFTASRNAYKAGRLASAIGYLEVFATTVVDHSGAEIPDVWQAGASLVNVAGALRVEAGTLRFSLVVKKNRLLGLL